MKHIILHPKPIDLYKEFKFRVKWEGHYVAGVSQVTVLKGTAGAVIPPAARNDATRIMSPQRSQYEPISMERGVTHDNEFVKWANATRHSNDHPGSIPPPADFRKNIIIEVFDEAGRFAESYEIFRCWVSDFQVLPDLDGNASAILIQSVKIENEGWKRDTEVTEPTEPLFTEPSR